MTTTSRARGAISLLPSAVFGDVFTVLDPAHATAAAVDVAGLADDRPALQLRIEATRRDLAATPPVETRVAASIWFRAAVTRLVSPVFGYALLTGSLPLLEAGDVRFTPDGRVVLDPADTVPACYGVLHPDVLGAVLDLLSDAVVAAAPVSPHVLHGDVASALVTAAGVVAEVRPDLATSAATHVRTEIATRLPPGSGRFGRAGFRRGSCCLAYRTPAGALCEDCILRSG